MTFCRASAVFLVAFSAYAPAIPAELPSRKSTPQAPARNCEINGKPGYKLPGSEVCLKLSGYVSGQISAGTLAK